jgi:hypothetical protein
MVKRGSTVRRRNNLRAHSIYERVDRDRLGASNSVLPFQAAVLSTSPTNFWPMTEGTGTPVDIVAARSTTLTGLSWLASGGKINNSPVLDFVGDSAKTLTFTTITDPLAGSFTWQIAARFDNLSQQMMLANSAAGQGYFYLQAATSLRFQTGDSSIAIVAPSAFSLSTWYLLHAVRVGSNITFYRDGVSLGTATAGNAATNIGAIGHYASSGGFEVDGRLSHVAHWNTALSQAQITVLATSWATGT